MLVLLPVLGSLCLIVFVPFVLLFIEVFSLVKKMKEKSKTKEVSKDEKE